MNQGDRPSIAEFYSHKDVFITGATGFLGKCLVEKLLRSVLDIGQVMILIRPKRGKTVQERVDSILASQVHNMCGKKSLSLSFLFFVLFC